MPVRFSCQQCGQKLSVKEEKVGKAVRCPKCQAKQVVPEAEDAAPAGVSAVGEQAKQAAGGAAPVPPPPPPGGSEAASGPPPVETTAGEGGLPAPPPPQGSGASSGVDFASLSSGDAGGGEEGDMFAEFAVYDEPAEWVYEEDTQDPDAPAPAAPKHYVAVPRTVLYVQGGLLAALAIFGFLFGFLAGRLSVDPSQANTTVRPANVSVVVLYHNEEGREVDDPRALVLILPADQPAEEKLTAVGMAPGDPELPETHDTFARLKVLGGDMARANENGRCTLRIPHQGSYYILCISENASVSGGAKPEDVAILGNYVLDAYELLDGTAYELMQRNVTGNTTVHFRFP